MGEKDSMKKEDNEKKVVDAGGTPKVEDSRITVVLKLHLHCDGCAKKIKRSLRYIEGVETVNIDSANNKLTIIGIVDPVHIKERVEFKTKKKVEIISPKPKKDDGGEKKVDDKPTEAKSNDQKPKEPQVITMVLKISLHCDGCIQKIKRIILKIDGVESVIADSSKNLVTVKGTMNMNELVPYLKEKLRRNVDIVPPKKEDNKVEEKKDEKKVEGGGDKKEKEGGNDGDDKKKTDVEKAPESNEGGEKKKNDVGKVTDGSEGGGEKKNDKVEATSGGDEKNKSDGEVKPPTGDGGSDGGNGGGGSKSVDLVNKSEYYRYNPYIYTMPVYNQNYHNQDYGLSVYPGRGYANEGYVNHGYVVEYPHGPPAPPPPMYLHDSRASGMDMLNAENPNACSIM
ncbi:heavy metal-associated isoprenylated plant protein 3-like [Cynara cardunculus var. scolymus]|uniref:Heavy metal-associated domain, HMA n=1 Tax=Cynara cardunculus var. scolymus TaxID=59895 RepID=A0A103XGR4_CYNCS|nr:heavy metal-associated isoprenylated plant protein 3-like [Cynara cardunculus var. scolymus]KVH90392.1 Heavy metal-associated domain, HMA [Cynara cardunculus var. scolymus]